MSMKYRGLHTYEDEEGNKLTKWVYGYQIVDETTGRAYILNGVVEASEDDIVIEDWREVKPETLGRCTGVTDIHSQEIYEGDIVKVHCYEMGYSSGGPYADEVVRLGVIAYGMTSDDLECFGPVYLPSWLLKTKDREYYCADLPGIDEESYEVLGNVYENPELLPH